MGKPFFTYEYGHPNELPLAKCNLEIHDNLVICSERHDNKGPSVTNRAEVLATEICEKFNITPRQLIWVEHYPENASKKYGGTDEERYNLVFFNMEGGGFFDSDEKVKFYNPRWVPITLEMVELLRISHQTQETSTEFKTKSDALEYIAKVALKAGLGIEGTSIGNFDDKEFTEIDEVRECDWITISK